MRRWDVYEAFVCSPTGSYVHLLVAGPRGWKPAAHTAPIIREAIYAQLLPNSYRRATAAYVRIRGLDDLLENEGDLQPLGPWQKSYAKAVRPHMCCRHLMQED